MLINLICLNFRVHIFSNRTDDDYKCMPKLVLLDLATGAVIRKYEFPKDVVSPKTNFLNDIVVACTSKEDCISYITDALDAKIIVYNYAENRSWFVHHSSMLANPADIDIKILGKSLYLSIIWCGVVCKHVFTYWVKCMQIITVSIANSNNHCKQSCAHLMFKRQD